MQSPPFPRYLVHPRSKYSPQHHVLKHPQLPFQLVHLVGFIVRITVLHIQTHINLNQTAQYLVLMLKHISATNRIRLHGVTVLEDTFNVLCNL